MLQYWQFQQLNGDHYRTEHVSCSSYEENGEDILLARHFPYKNINADKKDEKIPQMNIMALIH